MARVVAPVSLYEPEDWMDHTEYAKQYIVRQCKERKIQPEQVGDDEIKFALTERILKSPIFTIRNFFFTVAKTLELSRIEPWTGQLLFDLVCESQRKNEYAQRIIEIKPRQVGYTTWLIARGMWHAIQPNSSVVFMVPDDEVTKNLNKRVADVYNNLGWMTPLKRIENQGRVVFSNPDARTRDFDKGLESQVVVVVPGPIRGFSPTFVVLSEFAHYRDISTIDPSDMLTGLLSGMSAGAESAVFIDTTPNGYDEDYYPLVQEAMERNPKWVRCWERSSIPTKEEIVSGAFGQPDRPGSGWVPVFTSWLWHENYTTKDEHPLGQLKKLNSEQRKELVSTMGKLDKYGGEEELDLQKRYGATVERLAWRRWKLDTDIQGYDYRQKLLTFRQEYACLSSDTLIQTDKGLYRVDEVPIGAQGSSGEIIARINKGIKPTLTFTTECGFQIRCTHDHKILSTEGWVEAQDSMGKGIIIEAPIFSDDCVVWKRAAFGGSTTSTKITEDWGRFLGYFMADGSYYNATLSIACDAKDDDVVQDVYSLVRKLFCEPHLNTQTGARYVRASNIKFTEIFLSLGLLKASDAPRSRDRLMRKVCVPDVIWRSPKRVIRQFLRALFEGDGWRSPIGQYAKFFGKDPRFVRDIQILLLGFGVRCDIRCVSKELSGRTHTGAELVIRPGQIGTFMREIGFISKRKSERENRVTKGNGRPPKSYASSDLVVKIEESAPCETWDLTIDGSPQFGANGLVIHNSTAQDAFVDFGNQAFDSLGLAIVTRQWRHPSARGILKSDYNQQGASIEWTIDQTFHSPWEEMRFWAPPGNDAFVMGVDLGVSFENEEVDESYACVIRRRDLKQVAVYAARAPMHRVRQALYALYRYYNNAYTAVEVESNKSLVRELYDMGMRNQYRWKRLDQEIVEDSKYLGWETIHHTRDLMQGILCEEIARRNTEDKPEPGIILRDKRTIDQLLTIKRDSNGKFVARGGSKDDAAMALMIALAADRDTLHPYVPPRRAQERAVEGVLYTYQRLMSGMGPSERNRPRLQDL